MPGPDKKATRPSGRDAGLPQKKARRGADQHVFGGPPDAAPREWIDVEVIETNETEVIEKLTSEAPLWQDIVRDSVVVHGATLDELRGDIHG